jgi:hypothetical protein
VEKKIKLEDITNQVLVTLVVETCSLIAGVGN